MHDVLVYDELKRREREAWEPVPLQLPLHSPARTPSRPFIEDPEDDDDEAPRSSGVLIIDMNDYTELDA